MFIGFSSHVSFPKVYGRPGDSFMQLAAKKMDQERDFSRDFIGFSESWMGNSWDLPVFSPAWHWHRRWESLLFFEECSHPTPGPPEFEGSIFWNLRHDSGNLHVGCLNAQHCWFLHIILYIYNYIYNHIYNYIYNHIYNYITIYIYDHATIIPLRSMIYPIVTWSDQKSPFFQTANNFVQRSCLHTLLWCGHQDKFHGCFFFFGWIAQSRYGVQLDLNDSTLLNKYRVERIKGI